MASTYSSNLKIELMATGENSGTWGTNTNTNLGTAMEQAIIGLGNPDYTSDANLTITITDSSASQTARCLVLNVTSAFGSLTATRELIVPTIQKQYIVQNNTTGGQSITVKTSAGTGITVPNGRKAHLYVDGTNVIQMFDFVDINGGTIDGVTVGASSASTGAFTTLTASGATTLNGTVALGDAAGDLITVPGTVNSNLIFTDNSFDIGASGATRPRNLFLAGAATVAGNLSVGGTLTLTGGVNLNGNVTVGDSSADTLTINSTVTSNLIFTDNTYDIGASGATRPRSLFLAGNITAGGAQTLTGALTVDSTTDSTSTTTGSIQTDGGVGIAKALFVGTTANVAGVATFSAGTAALPAITTTGDTNTGVFFPAADTIAFAEGGAEAMRINSGGSLLLGLTSSRTNNLSSASLLQLEAVNSAATGALVRNSADTSGAGLILGKSRGTSVGSFTAVVSGDRLGTLSFSGTDGTTMLSAATILSEVDGTPGTNDMPGRLVFSTTADGGSSPTERMRIDSSGNVGIGTTTPAYPLDVTGIIRRYQSSASVLPVEGVRLEMAGNNAAARGLFMSFYGPGGLGTSREVARINGLVNSGTDTGGFLSFETVTGATGTNVEHMRIDSSGNVGIGTTSPTSTLSVTGTANVTGNVTLGDATTDTVTVNGYMGVGGAGAANVGMAVQNTALTGTGQYGLYSDITGTTAATSTIAGLYLRAKTVASAFTVSGVYGAIIQNAVKGAGSTITNQWGVYVADQTQGTNNYGITSLVSSGTDKWNIYASGTAQNYFAGNVGIGTSSAGQKLVLNGGFQISGSATLSAAQGAGLFSFETPVIRAYIGDGTGYSWAFSKRASSTTTDLMTITDGGNVGIGTSSPTSTLSVTGTANVTGNVTLGDATTDTVTVNGYMGVGGAGASNKGMYQRNTALTGIGQYGVTAEGTFSSAATSLGVGFASSFSTEAAAFTMANAIGFRAFDITKGAGSTITNQHGVYIADQTQGTNNYGITSLVSSGTNKWNIYASGTAQNYFAGNVGVGTSSPATKFVVEAATPEVRISSSVNTVSNTNTLRFSSSASSGTYAGGGAYIQSIQGSGVDVYSLAFGTAQSSTTATERMRIDSSGSVGIGTSSPAAKVHVEGSGTTTAATVLVKNISTAASTYGSVETQSDSTSALYLRTYSLATTSAAFGTALGGASLLGTFGAASTGMLVGTNNATPLILGTSNNERMRIDSSGNVGIGTTSPGAKLTTANSYVVPTNGVSSSTVAIFSNNAVASGEANISVLSRSSGYSRMYFGSQTQENAQYIEGYSPGSTAAYLAFGTGTGGSGVSGTERIRIDSSGNVGIGTSSPSASAILDAQSTTKGVRMPNMTTTQKNAISSPAAGLMVFDTTLVKLCVYSGSAWQTVTSI